MSSIMVWVMAYIKHWMLSHVVMDISLDYVELGYIDDKDGLGFRLLMGFLMKRCIIQVL